MRRSVQLAAGSTIVLSACNTARGEVSRKRPLSFVHIVGLFVHGHSSVLQTPRPHRTVPCGKTHGMWSRMQVRGEGVLGLSRAFLGAGAGAAVVSLWSVDDASTGLLMNAMYAALHRGARPERCQNCTHPQC